MSYKKDRENSPERVKLSGFLGEFREALEDEIEKIERNGLSSTLLSGGRRIERCGEEFWYRFHVEYIPELPADTPCKLTIGKDQFDATVVSFEENTIIVATKEPLPEAIASARLENSAAILMERLIKRIEENAETENRAGKHMLPTQGNAYAARRIFSYNDLELGQNNTQCQNWAIAAALSNDITYIWGPPGTGKTTVIGQIINELYKHDRSVLVVSHTNTAVDGAIEKADKAYYSAHPDGGDAYPILRIGTPARPLPQRVLLDHHVAVLGKELHEQKAKLEQRKSEIQKRLGQLAPMIAKAVWIEANKLDEIDEILKAVSANALRIGKISREIEEIDETIQREKAAHPEYEEFLTLSNAIRGKEARYKALCMLMENNQEAISKRLLQKQKAQDEIKKHDEYVELCAQERELGSVSSIRTELDTIASDIATLNSEIAALSASQDEAERVIAEFQRKGLIGRGLMSFSGALTQARATLQKTGDLLPLAQQRMQQLRNRERENEQRLGSLLALRERIKAAMPTQTKAYWEDELQRTEEQLAQDKRLRSRFLAEEPVLQSEIGDLKRQQSRAKEAFDQVAGYEERRRQAQAELETVKAECAKENGRCTEQLGREKAYCAAFSYVPAAQDNEALFTELTRLLTEVKNERAERDTQSLLREKEDAEHELSRLFSRLNEVRQKIEELEKQAITNAKIVGATLAKSYLSDMLRARKFDTVILDEASMASIPALWCAAYLAENSLVIVGDFLQLSPIVMAETPMAKKWLGRDIFDHSGMRELAKNPKTCPENFVMLNDQFRMESDIADIANMYYGAYGGLRSHDASECRVREREAFYAWFAGEKTGQSVRLIDTESLHAWATSVPQGKGNSRMNCFSAAVDVDLAFKLLENKLNALEPETAMPEKEASVLIVAPYKPHAKRINQLIELEYRNRGFRENLNLIRAGTIHSFQGSEADIVIFDLVVDEPHRIANLFMKDGEVNEGLRKMFNVAVTRAKFKLYIVGNFKFCQKGAKDNALSEMLDKLLVEKGLAKIDAKTLLPDLIYTRQTDFVYDGKLAARNLICQESSFGDYFMADICAFKKRLIIYSPFMTQERIGALLPAFADAIGAGKQIIVVTKAPSDRRANERAHYWRCEKELRDIGVHILHKMGMHEKLIFVDDEVVWMGSLNALSFTGRTGEVMHRFADEDLAKMYEELFEIEHINGAVERAYEQKCPVCGDEMQIREGSEGGIFWQCVRKDYSRNTKQQYPMDGIMRCECGAPYAFDMKNEPRWVCTKNSRHYRKMREGDLKLEKMAALIPTKTARRAVDRYFAQKKKEQEAKQKKTTSKATKAATKKKNADGFEQMKMF